MLQNCITSVLIFCCTLFLPIFAQAQDSNQVELKQRPAQLSFLPPLSTNGLESHQVVNNLSINLIAGYQGGLEGLEMGGFANILRHDMKGLQLAGFGNNVFGQTLGTQISGFYNYSHGTCVGAQLAGFANVVTDSAWAFQAAGFSNVVTGDFKGAQLSGFTNTTVGKMKGTQLAGFANIAVDSMVGTQVAGFANIAAGDVKGMQASGFINVARKVNGLQLGIININDTVDQGVAIGLLNISRRGVWDLELESSLSFHGLVQLKTGSERLYSIFSAGASQRANSLMWAYGYGLGTQFPISQKLDMNIDLTSHRIVEPNAPAWSINQLNRLKVNVAYPLNTYMKVYAGPSFNVLHSTITNNEGELTGGEFAPYTLYEQNLRFTNIKMYPGFNLGIRF